MAPRRQTTSATPPVLRAERTVRQLILEGTHRPGARLSDLRLSKELGISRSQIREALQRLVYDGTLTDVPERGVFVTSIDSDPLTELLEVREALEVQVVRLATIRASWAHIDQLDELLTITGLAIAETGHYPAALDFHVELAALAHSPMLERQLAEVNHALKLARTRSGFRPERADDAHVEHQWIVAALRERNVESAEMAMRDHLAQARASMERLGADISSAVY